jgi:hypothetical protein
MNVFNAGGRFAAASVSLCLLLLASASPSSAINRVTGAGGGGGGGICANCGQNQSQTSTTAGTASGGTATNNPGGSGSTFDINYGVPNDGQTYSGQLMTEVTLPDGSVSVQTWPISDYAGGSSNGYATGWNNATIPIGGSASISISETAPNGATFTAGFTVTNFGQ